MPVSAPNKYRSKSPYMDQQDYKKPARTGGHIGSSEEGGKNAGTERSYPVYFSILSVNAARYGIVDSTGRERRRYLRTPDVRLPDRSAR